MLELITAGRGGFVRWAGKDARRWMATPPCPTSGKGDTAELLMTPPDAGRDRGCGAPVDVCLGPQLGAPTTTDPEPPPWLMTPPTRGGMDGGLTAAWPPGGPPSRTSSWYRPRVRCASNNAARSVLVSSSFSTSARCRMAKCASAAARSGGIRAVGPVNAGSAVCATLKAAHSAARSRSTSRDAAQVEL